MVEPVAVIISPAVYDDIPVPPLATANVPDVIAAALIFVALETDEATILNVSHAVAPLPKTTLVPFVAV